MSESNSADVFSADKFIQLAPSGPISFGKYGPYLLEDLDDNGLGDRGIDLDKDGDVDLAIWSFPSKNEGWSTDDPTYTFRSYEHPSTVDSYARISIPRLESFSLENINKIAAHYDQKISQVTNYVFDSQFISDPYFGEHYPQSSFKYAGVHWIFIDDAESLIRFAVDPVNFKLYYSDKIDLRSVAPIISSFSPADNATGVAIDSDIILNFSEVVDVESGNIVIYKSSDDFLVGTIDVTSGQVEGTGTTQIKINPASDLEEQTQ